MCPADAACPFRGLNPKVFAEFQNIGRTKIYDLGTPIFHQGAPIEAVFVVCSGLVKLTHVAPAGRANTLGILGPGSILGLTDLVSGTRSETGAEAFEQSIVCVVSERAFRAFLAGNPSAAVELLRSTSSELNRILAEFCEVIGKVPSSARLMHVLQDLAATCGHSTIGGVRLDLVLTEEELAHRIGCSRQWTSELLQEFEARGLIRHTRGHIELKTVDPPHGIP